MVHLEGCVSSQIKGKLTCSWIWPSKYSIQASLSDLIFGVSMKRKVSSAQMRGRRYVSPDGIIIHQGVGTLNKCRLHFYGADLTRVLIM